MDIPLVDRIDHRAVEVSAEPVGDHPQLVQVEVGVASDERIERPSHQRDPLLQRLGPLSELQGVPHARVSAIGECRQHVRVHVESVLRLDRGQ